MQDVTVYFLSANGLSFCKHDIFAEYDYIPYNNLSEANNFKKHALNQIIGYQKWKKTARNTNKEMLSVIAQ